MKNIKKTIYVETITLVIVGLLMLSTVNIIAQEPQITENKVNTIQIFTNKFPIPQSTQKTEVTIPSTTKQKVLPSC